MNIAARRWTISVLCLSSLVYKPYSNIPVYDLSIESCRLPPWYAHCWLVGSPIVDFLHRLINGPCPGEVLRDDNNQALSVLFWCKDMALQTVYRRGCYLRCTLRILHLSGWKSIPQFRSHSSRCTKSCRSISQSSVELISLYRTPSSANSLAHGATQSGRSLMNTRKSIGPMHCLEGYLSRLAKRRRCRRLPLGSVCQEWPYLVMSVAYHSIVV